MNKPPWPCYTQEEIDAVTRILRSNKVNYWTGEEGRLFEKEFAKAQATKHAIALNNGTSALEISLKAVGVGANDQVIVSPRSFFASASAIVAVGAVPLFVDVDPDSQNLCPNKVEAAITPRCKAIIAVHLGGWPCDMDPLLDLAKTHKLYLIEDCAQAHGAFYKGRPVGSIGDVAAWSFCQDKIITTGGEGGMITCQDTDLFKRIWSLKDHGKDWDVAQKTNKDLGFRWLHSNFGTNARMTEMQAAIGRIQLRRLEAMQQKRARNAQNLKEIFTPFSQTEGPLRLPHYHYKSEKDSGLSRHAWYRFTAFVRSENFPKGLNRDTVIKRLNDKGLFCQQGICPEIYQEAAFEEHPGRPKERLNAARMLGETSLTFLTHPGLDYRSFMEQGFDLAEIFE